MSSSRNTRKASGLRRWIAPVAAMLMLAGAPVPALAGAAIPGGATTLTVFAAASLTDAMKTIGPLWAAQGHAAPRFSFASSAVLAQQLAQGAPADLFISADRKWMDFLATAKLIRAQSRTELLGNSLVLVEPAATLKPVVLRAGLDPALLAAGGRLAVGDPASVPAGLYAKQALTRLGLWNAVSGRLAPAENVRAALLLVEHGEAPAGIVYGSDVLAAPSLGVAGTFPDDSHDPIRYPAAVLQATSDPDRAASFLAFLRSDAARAVFVRDGFTVPGAR